MIEPLLAFGEISETTGSIVEIVTADAAAAHGLRQRTE